MQTVPMAFSSVENDFAVSREMMASFVEECGQIPNEDQMRREIAGLLAIHRKRRSPTRLSRMATWVGFSRDDLDAISSVDLDGLQLSSINPFDLDLIERLTIHHQAYDQFGQYGYSIVRKLEGGVLRIERQCSSRFCQNLNLDLSGQLRRFNGPPVCDNAVCVAERLFGSPKGIYILWAYLKLALNISPFNDPFADPDGLSIENIRALLIAIAAVPSHLHPFAVQNQKFFHFLRGKTLALFEGRRVLATEWGDVFDLFDELSFGEKVYALFHELGHRSSKYLAPSLVRMPTWMAISGWKINPEFQLSRLAPNFELSWVAQQHPDEDWAESFSSYRFDPHRLDRVSHERYNFLKEMIFLNAEFKDKSCDKAKID